MILFETIKRFRKSLLFIAAIAAITGATIAGTPDDSASAATIRDMAVEDTEIILACSHFNRQPDETEDDDTNHRDNPDSDTHGSDTDDDDVPGDEKTGDDDPDDDKTGSGDGEDQICH